MFIEIPEKRLKDWYEIINKSRWKLRNVFTMESTPGDQIGATIGTGDFTKRYIYLYGLFTKRIILIVKQISIETEIGTSCSLESIKRKFFNLKSLGGSINR